MVEEHDETLKLVSSLWHSNFRNLEVASNRNVFVLIPTNKLHGGALKLLMDIAENYNHIIHIYASNAGFDDVMRASFSPIFIKGEEV